MSRIRHISGRVWDKLLRETGVEAFNGAQGRILYVLWEHGDMTITQLGRLTSLAKTTLTSMLDRMETAGLVSRVPDQRNRRQIIICVTDKARSYSGMYDHISDRANDIFYKGFSEAEIIAFEDNLRRILRNFQEEEG